MKYNIADWIPFHRRCAAGNKVHLHAFSGPADGVLRVSGLGRPRSHNPTPNAASTVAISCGTARDT
jgi:hypothetical protein